MRGTLPLVGSPRAQAPSSPLPPRGERWTLGGVARGQGYPGCTSTCGVLSAQGALLTAGSRQARCFVLTWVQSPLTNRGYLMLASCPESEWPE